MLLCFTRLVYDSKTRNPMSITGYLHIAAITTCYYPHINSNSETVVGLVFRPCSKARIFTGIYVLNLRYVTYTTIILCKELISAKCRINAMQLI